jgi:hypothetical protein
MRTLLRTAILAGLILLVGACASPGASYQPPDSQPKDLGEVGFGGDTLADLPQYDGYDPTVCTLLWKKSTYLSSTAGHPAFDRGRIYVGALGKLYALGETGTEVFIWPDQDDQSGVTVPEGMLVSPSIGNNGVIYTGLVANGGGGGVLALNTSGMGKWYLDLETPVAEAPAVLQDGSFIALGTDGKVARVRDFGQDKPYVVWSGKPGEALGLLTPVAGAQPVLDEVTDGANPRLWVLYREGLLLLDLDGGVKGSFLLDDNGDSAVQATGNLLPSPDGSLCFPVASESLGPNLFAKLGVACLAGPAVALDYKYLELGSGMIGSLSEGRDGTWLLGTSNLGLRLVYRETGALLGGHFESFQDCAQAVQGADGLIYFGAKPSWLKVLNVNGDLHWQDALKNSEGELDAVLAPSSPLLFADGLVVFHAGNQIAGLKCGDSGPAGNAFWPRYGGNERNTGNLADSLAGE